MDDIDKAQELEQKHREAALSRAKGKQRLKATGFCYYCNSDVLKGYTFCDAECRDDYEKEQRLLKLSGKQSEE